MLKSFFRKNAAILEFLPLPAAHAAGGMGAAAGIRSVAGRGTAKGGDVLRTSVDRQRRPHLVSLVKYGQDHQRRGSVSFGVVEVCFLFNP